MTLKNLTASKGFVWSVCITFGWFTFWLMYSLVCYVANNLE